MNWVRVTIHPAFRIAIRVDAIPGSPKALSEKTIAEYVSPSVLLPHTAVSVRMAPVHMPISRREPIIRQNGNADSEWIYQFRSVY